MLTAAVCGLAVAAGLVVIRHAAAGYYQRMTADAVPVLHVVFESYDFGTVSRGDEVRIRIPVTNRGTARLVLLEQSRSCACLAAESETLVGPGAMVVLEVVLETARLSGEVHQVVSWWTSDPARPELRCAITGRIAD